MPTQDAIRFSELASSDLNVDAVYEGGRRGNASDDPLHWLVGVSNSGGFRYRGSLGKLSLLVLTSTFTEPDWPDSLDRETGVFTYYGDNRRPGRSLHETPRFGNEILRSLFDAAYAGADKRRSIPPIFLFANTGSWRDVRFLGIAVPGSPNAQTSEDLVAVWKTVAGKRFQNYRARFTVLDLPTISRAWINDLIAGQVDSPHCPPAWHSWLEGGLPRALLAPRVVDHRSKSEQLPDDPTGKAMINSVRAFFESDPHKFEHCAALLCRLLLPDIASLDVTRPSRDGGRDGLGLLRIGVGDSSILIDFALEAKCYGVSNGVGVRDISRLISRLRHRQFGIIVTTSYVDSQAYKEIKEDRHPIIVLAAADIIALLKKNGIVDRSSVELWLKNEFM